MRTTIMLTSVTVVAITSLLAVVTRPRHGSHHPDSAPRVYQTPPADTPDSVKQHVMA